MESPYKEILSAIVGGSLIGGIIQLAKFISDRIDKKKADKLAAQTAEEEKAQIEISNTVEFKRLEQELDDATYKRVLEMLRTSQAEEHRLRLELKELQSSPSLSNATITKMYRAYRDLGAEINLLSFEMTKQNSVESLTNLLARLKARYDELGERLP